MNPRLRINDQISVSPVHLIDQDGTSHGEVELAQAKKLANEAGLDLVEINPHLKPPICKIVEFGKFKYEQAKKERDGKKSHQGELKEVRFRLKTDDHDRRVKLRKTAEFLNLGYKVQVTLMMQGREQAFVDLAFKRLGQFIEELTQQVALKVDKPPERFGNRLNCIVVREK